MLVMVVALLPANMVTASSLQGDTNKNGTVDVTFTISEGVDDFYTTANGNQLYLEELNVPYFDLALYDLEEYYYNPECYTGTEQKAGTKASAEGVVTAMHVFIYATELYVIGAEEKDCGKGEFDISPYISWSQGAGSSYMNFWNGSTNLNYYLNYEFPLGRDGWGSTSDQQAMEDGTSINVHLIKDGEATGSNYGFFVTESDERDVAKITEGEKLTLTFCSTITKYGEKTSTKTVSDVGVYYIPADEYSGEALGSSWILLGNTDENGQITIPESLRADRYYISAMGEVSDGFERAPAAFILKVNKPAREVPFGDVNDDGSVTSADAVQVLRYTAGSLSQTALVLEAADVNGDGSVTSADASLILKRAAGTILAFPVE